MNERSAFGLRVLSLCALMASCVSAQSTSPAGCVPQPTITITTSRSVGQPEPTNAARSWEAVNTGHSNVGEWASSFEERFSPNGGSSDVGHVRNAETRAGQEVTGGENGVGAASGRASLHAKSLIYVWAEDHEARSRNAVASAEGTFELGIVCSPLTGHTNPPPGTVAFSVTNEVRGWYKVQAQSGIRKSGSVQLLVVPPFSSTALDWSYDLVDSTIESERESVSTSGGVEANLSGTVGVSATGQRHSVGGALGITATREVTTSRQVTLDSSVTKDGHLHWPAETIKAEVHCHGVPEKRQGRVATAASISVEALAGDTDVKYAAAEIWGTMTTTIHPTVTATCASGTATGGGGGTGGSGGGTTGGGGGGPAGGGGSGTTPPSDQGPSPPPSGGRTKSEESGSGSPTLAGECGGAAYSQGVTPTPTRDYERWAPFVIRVSGNQDGEALSAPLHCRVAPGQTGISFMGVALAEQVQLGFPPATLELSPVGPFRFSSGTWVLSIPYTGGAAGWIFFEASFDPEFPAGNTARIAVELISQPFTLAELSLGAHLWTNVESRIVVRSAGPLPESIPILLVDREFDSSTLAVSWSQLSGSEVEWDMAPRIVLAPAGEARPSIAFKGVLPREASAKLLMSLASPGHSLDFILDLGN